MTLEHMGLCGWVVIYVNHVSKVVLPRLSSARLMAAPTSDGLAPANSRLLIAQLMAAQLGSGLAMTHIQKL